MQISLARPRPNRVYTLVLFHYPRRACAARVRLSVCVRARARARHLTSPMFVCLTNDTTYLTGNEGQKFRAVLSENAPLQGYTNSGSSIVRLMRSRPFLSLRKCACAIYSTTW